MVHSLQILSDRRAFICRLFDLCDYLSLGPRKLRIDAENIQIAEVKESDFMEYVDVEGLIQPILTIKINTRETGSVERIVGEEEVCFSRETPFLFFPIPICSAILKTSVTNGKSK